MNETTVELDLREWGRALLKRIWIIVLSAVVLGAAVLVYTARFVPPKYMAEVTMYLNNRSSSLGGDYMDSSDYAVALRQVETYTKIITSNAVLDKVAEQSGLKITGDQIRGMMSATAVGETEMFKVSVISTDPEMSAKIANTIADVAPTTIKTQFKLGSEAHVVDYARVPRGRYSPSYTVNTVIGAFAGAVMAAVAILLQMHLDVRVKKEADLSKIFKAPVLGTIPELADDMRRPVSRKVRN